MKNTSLMIFVFGIVILFQPFSAFSTGHWEVLRDEAPIKENLNDVMKKFSPRLSLKIPDLVFKKSDYLDINLTFERYQDFRPENILMQVDFLKRLVAARNLLKELKSHIIDSESLRKSLEELVRSKIKAQSVYKELKRFRLDRSK